MHNNSLFFKACFRKYWIKIQKKTCFGSIKKINNHEKNLFLLGLMACSMTMMGQTDKKATKKVGISSLEDLILQATATEFPVSGQQQIEIFM
jgi:hypothetical protein